MDGWTNERYRQADRALLWLEGHARWGHPLWLALWLALVRWHEAQAAQIEAAAEPAPEPGAPALTERAVGKPLA